jgi:hypothetical protein
MGVLYSIHSADCCNVGCANGNGKHGMPCVLQVGGVSMQTSEGVEVVAAAQCRRKQSRSGAELVCSFGEKIWWRVGGAYAIEVAALSASGHEDA